jgi:hypothetical protein
VTVTVHLTDAGAVLARLEEIEKDLEVRQNALESAALAWYRVKRDREKEWALVFLRSAGTVAERKAVADRDTSLMGKDEEALYESLRAVVRTLETRASIGQSILRSQGRS